MKYKFIGDENDPKTKKWGLKFGEIYIINQLDIIPQIIVIINAPIGKVQCPYSSFEAFNKNWELAMWNN